MNKIVIDVSSHQGVIDWEKVKSHIDGAILRVGYGQDIAKQHDKQFQRNASECTRLGIPFGVYLYSYAKDEKGAKGEAQHILNQIKGLKLDYPVYIDLEEPGTEAYAKIVGNTVCSLIERAGYWAGIYASENWWKNYLKGVNNYTKWVAKYSSSTPKVNAYDMWQYTSGGTINGINGRVDVSHCYRDFPALINKQSATPNIIINGAGKNMDIIFKNNKNYVSVRELGEALGYKVTSNGSTPVLTKE